MAFEGRRRWCLWVHEPKVKRRYVEHSWHETERQAREEAKKLPAGSKWKVEEY